MASASQRTATHIAVIFGVGLVARLFLIYRYPIIFGADSITRLAKADHIALLHELPLLQAVIHYLTAVSPGPLLVQLFMVVAGSAAGVGFYLLLSNLVPSAAVEGSLLFVTTPLILEYSLVPYQEILMLGGLLFAFHFALTGRWELASLSLGVACLSRYEAWLACPVLGLAYVHVHGRAPRALLAAAALFGWAPLTWMVYNRGITPAGTHAIELSSNPERFLRWAHLGTTALRNSALPTLLLAGWGAGVFLRKRLFRIEAYQMLVAFLALFLVAILFSAHGVGEHPERLVTGREAHIPLVGIALLAALGVGSLARFRYPLTALSMCIGLWMADRFVRLATSEPHLALSYRVARYVDRTVAPGEVVVVLARGRGADAQRHLAGVERRQGPEGVERARRTLRELDMAKPPDYDLILVHSTLGKDRLLSYATLSLGRFTDSTTLPPDGPAQIPRPQWIVLWSDFAPTNPVEVALAAQVLAAQPHQGFGQDSVWVRVYAARQ